MSTPSTKKRKTNGQAATTPAGYSIASTSASTFSDAPLAEHTAPVPAPAPPMSALQARRAAQALLAASAPAPSADEDESDSDGSAVERALASSSDSETDIEEAVTLAQAKLNKKRAKLARMREKGKGKQAGRYFAGEEDGEAAGAVGMELDRPSQRLSHQPSGNADEEAGASKLSRGARRRKEKAAFTDPACCSAFSPRLGVNAWKLPWGGFVFGLGRDESLIIHGSYKLAPLSGAVSVLSSILSASPSPPSLATRPAADDGTAHAVFAPSSHPLPILYPLPLSQPPASIPLSDGGHIQGRDFDSVVLVYAHQSGIEGVEKPLRAGGMSSGGEMWESEAGAGWGDKGWQLILDLTPSVTSLRMPEPWTSTLETIVPTRAVLEQIMSGVAGPMGGDRLVLLVEGPKRVGKSTFARLLLNRLLAQYEQVAYLDTDLGQPEFSPPGFVSLSVLSAPALGPSFTHQSIPPFAHYTGTLSPATDPAAYLAAVSALFASYTLSVEFPAVEGRAQSNRIRDRVPLVINTQGWVKGLGADLLTKLKQEVQPTHIFSFDGPVFDEQGADGNASGEGRHFAWQNEMDHQPIGAALWRLPAAPSSPLDAKWTASDLRTLSLVAYFHAEYPPPSPTTDEDLVRPASILPAKWNFDTPLVAQAPLNVDWRVTAKLIERVHVLGGEVAYEQILHALNGAVVGLVASTSATAEDNATAALPPFPYSPYGSPPHPAQSCSLGLALVRGIDPGSSTLQLLTPLAPATLAAHSPLSLVLGGAIELPLPLLLDFSACEVDQLKGVAGVPWREVPHLSVEEGERGQGRRRVRKNLMRRGHN